ncbi:MAG: hypothetical protein ACRDQ7_25410 [Haloechinothrix sp.]
MTEGFFADADRLAARSGDFDGFAERAGKAADALRSALASGGPAWGTDAVGASFAAAHADPAAHALDLIAGLRPGLGEMGTKFADAATEYRAADESAIIGITAAGRDIGRTLGGEG